MKAIINRESNFGTLDGVITKNDFILKIINEYLKKGQARKIIDSEDTLMYILIEKKSNSNLHPIFENILKPYMP